MLAGDVAVHPQSRSNIVHRVERHGVPVAYVKQRGAASLLDGDDAVAAERRALTSLGGLAAVPALLPVPDPAAVWVAAVAGEPFTALPVGGERFHAACRALAVALVEVHRHPVSPDAPDARRPWAFGPGGLPASMRGWPEDSGCATVLAAAAEPELAAAVEHASARWGPQGWIHGDVALANVLVVGDRAVLVDWEGAGLGDPAWDLASAVGLLRDLDPQGAQAFLTAYWRAGGPAPLDDGVLAVRALQTAWQAAATALQAGRADLDVAPLLEAARTSAASFRRSSGGTP